MYRIVFVYVCEWVCSLGFRDAECDSCRWWTLNTHTQNERRDKTGSTIDRVSGPSEMKLTIIIQQVNDDTEKKEEEKRLQSRKYCETTATKKKKRKKRRKNHATQPKCFGLPQSTWLSFLYFRFYISHFLFNFLDFTVVMKHMPVFCFLSSFLSFFFHFGFGLYLHLYSGQSHFPCVFFFSFICWNWICNCAIVMRIRNKKESKRSRSRSSLSLRIRNWWRKKKLESGKR